MELFVAGILIGAFGIIFATGIYNLYMSWRTRRNRLDQSRRNELIGDIANAVYWKIKEAQDE